MGLAAFFPPSHAFSPSQAPSSPCTMTDRPHHQGKGCSRCSTSNININIIVDPPRSALDLYYYTNLLLYSTKFQIPFPNFLRSTYSVTRICSVIYIQFLGKGSWVLFDVSRISCFSVSKALNLVPISIPRVIHAYNYSINTKQSVVIAALSMPLYLAYTSFFFLFINEILMEFSWDT